MKKQPPLPLELMFAHIGIGTAALIGLATAYMENEKKKRLRIVKEGEKANG